MGKIMIEVPECLPLGDFKKKIDMLIREEDGKQALYKKSSEKNGLREDQANELEEQKGKTWKEDRKRILEKYYGIIKLYRPVSLEEILDLEEDAWLY